jgi:hypothetical protein
MAEPICDECAGTDDVETVAMLDAETAYNLCGRCRAEDARQALLSHLKRTKADPRIVAAVKRYPIDPADFA